MMGSPSQPLPSRTYAPDTCLFCHESLHITTSADTDTDRALDDDEALPTTVIDDVELYCGPPGSGPSGHHAHWTCLIDHAKLARPPVVIPGMSGSGTSSVSTCLVCGQNTLDPSGRFVVDVRNEGGETKGFDFGVILEEELYLDSHPNQVHIRALHDLVAEGDYAGAIELIAEHDVDVNATYSTDGLTALQKAMFSGDTSGIEFLRSLGATM